MRVATLISLAVLTAGCAVLRNADASGTDETVFSPPTAVRPIVIEQLRLRGYTVSEVGTTTVITVPRPVPDSLRSSGLRGTQYLIQVVADTNQMVGGTHVVVNGFLVPTATSADTAAGAGGARRPLEAILVKSSDAPLYREVQRTAQQIIKAASAGRRR